MAKKDQVLGYVLDDVSLVNGKLRNAIVKCQYETAEDEHSDSFDMQLDIDFEGIELKTLLAYAVSPLIIRRQAQERKAGEEEATKFYGSRVHYSLMGKKIVSPEKLAEQVTSSVEAMPNELKMKLFEQLKAQMESGNADELDDDTA